MHTTPSVSLCTTAATAQQRCTRCGLHEHAHYLSQLPVHVKRQLKGAHARARYSQVLAYTLNCTLQLVSWEDL